MKNESKQGKNYELSKDQIKVLVSELERLTTCVRNVTSILEEVGAIDANGNRINSTPYRRSRTGSFEDRDTQDQNQETPPATVTQSSVQIEQIKKTKSDKLSVGDKVKVLNKWGGNKGTVGVITSVTNSQVWIQPDGNGAAFRKWKDNVKRIS